MRCWKRVDNHVPAMHRWRHCLFVVHMRISATASRQWCRAVMVRHLTVLTVECLLKNWAVMGCKVKPMSDNSKIDNFIGRQCCPTKFVHVTWKIVTFFIRQLLLAELAHEQLLMMPYMSPSILQKFWQHHLMEITKISYPCSDGDKKFGMEGMDAKFYPVGAVYHSAE